MDEENKIEQKIEDENKKEEVSSTVLKTQGITTEENVSIEDYNVSNSREVASENVSNNETQQEQKSEENSSLYDNISSYMSENIDLMADSRESDIAFDRGLAEALDNLDKNDFNSLSDVINDIKEKLENENDRASDKLFEQEATSEKVVEGNKDDLAEFGNAVQDFKDLTNSEEAQAYKEEQLSPENTKAGELFEKRDELMEQLENPKDGTFEIEQQLESINEKISELTTDDLRDYNNALSSEITQEQREEQKASEEMSREGNKDDLAEFGNAVQDFKDLTNSEEAQAYKEEVLASENNNDMKTEVSNDSSFETSIESKEQTMKEEIMKMSYEDYAFDNIPEADKESFVNYMSSQDLDLTEVKSVDELVELASKNIESFENNKEDFELYKIAEKELEKETSSDKTSEETKEIETSAQKETGVSR
jgi:hypothetical protein